VQAYPSGKDAKLGTWRRLVTGVTALLAAVAGVLVVAPALPAGASTALTAVVSGATGPTVPTAGNPVPAATASLATLSTSAVTPTTGDVAMVSSSQVFLLVNTTNEPAADYGLGSTGNLVKGDVYLLAGGGVVQGWTAQISNTGTASAPAKAVANAIGRPQAVAFDPSGNLLFGSNATGEANVVLVPKVTGPTFGYSSAMAGYPYFIAGFTPATASNPPAPAVKLPSAITFSSIATSTGLTSGSNLDVVVGTASGVSLLNYGASQTYYGGSQAANSYTAVGAGGSAACTSGAQNVPSTGSSSFSIVTGAKLFVDGTGNLYVGNLNATGCEWVLPKVSGTLVLDGASTPVTAGNAYKWAGNGISPKTTAPTNGTSAVTTSIGVAAAVTEDPAGNIVFLMGGSTATTTKINGAYVIANTNGTYYGQAMTAGDFYTIAGSAAHTLGKFRTPAAVGSDGVGNLWITDSNTHQEYELTGGPTAPAGPPSVTSVSPSKGSTAGGTSVTITGKGFTGTTAVTFGSTAATAFTVTSPTTITATTPAHAAGGVAVTVTNANGPGVEATGFTYVAPPTVTTVSPTKGPLGGGTPVTITGTGFGATSTVKFGSASATVSAHTTTQLTVTAPAGTAPGQVDVLVTTTGITSSAGASDKFTYDPTVASLSTTKGSTAGGTSVTITGTGFAATSTVKFGSATATVSAHTSTTLTVTSPAGTAGAQPVVVTTNGASSTTAVNFTYVAPPTVTAVSPTKGPLGGGTPVTITGTGFGATSTVKFGSASATVSAHTTTQLTVTAPAGTAPGQVDVLVTTTGITSSAGASDKFTYDPTVTSVTPNQGSTLGGTPVVLIGHGFSANSTVKFGSATATVTGHTGTTKLVVTAPAGSGQVNVTVTTNGGTSTTTVAFTYVVPPTITTVSPTTGNYQGGTAVTITGSHLTGAQVTFGTSGAQTVVVAGDGDSLTAVTPQSVAGSVAVVVTTPGGTAKLTTGFLYTATAPVQPSGSTTWTTGSSTSASGTATAAAKGVNATAAGAGTVGAGLYSTNPASATPTGATGVYVDVAVGAGSSFSSVTITVCNLAGGDSLDWLNGGTWSAFSSQRFDSSTGCITATVNNQTSPSLNQLTGTVIAVVKTGTKTTTTAPPVPTTKGYYEVASDGGIFAFGAPFYGSTGTMTLNQPVVGIAVTPDGKGYWEVASDGGIFAFGDAAFYGSTGSMHLNEPIVGMAATPDGKGYWLVASDGGIFAFGDAAFYGSTGSMHLNEPVVGMEATPDGMGYWMVASDGGIFAFGDATFHGSTGGMTLNKPVVGLATTSDGKGYWLVASDGGIFAFGDATFYGSAGSLTLNQPVVGLAATPDGMGYWLVAADGGIFSYGDAGFAGSMGGKALNKPIVGIAAVPGT